MTIDRKSRDQMASLLVELVQGEISNFDFEETSISSHDPILWAIESSVWCLYDDFKEHKLDNLSPNIKKMITRWILFLRGNEEYKWPKILYPGIRPLKHGFLSRLLGRQRKEEQFMACGDYCVWPFFSEESFNKTQCE